MPPAVVAAGIGAAGAIGGAVLGSRAANKASDTQAQANSEALQFQREQANKAEQVYKQQWDQWNRQRQALMQRYGIDIAPPNMQQGPQGMSPQPTGPQGMAPGKAVARPPMMGAQPPGGAPTGPGLDPGSGPPRLVPFGGGQTLADLAGLRQRAFREV